MTSKVWMVALGIVMLACAAPRDGSVANAPGRAGSPAAGSAAHAAAEPPRSTADPEPSRGAPPSDCEAYCTTQSKCFTQVPMNICLADCSRVEGAGLAGCRDAFARRNTCLTSLPCRAWQRHVDNISLNREDTCTRDEKLFAIYCAGFPAQRACLTNCDKDRYCAGTIPDMDTCAIKCMDDLVVMAQKHGLECQNSDIMLKVCKSMLSCDQLSDFRKNPSSEWCSREKNAQKVACHL